MKKLIAWLLVLLLCVSVGMTAYAATPYRTYSLGSGMREVETQTRATYSARVSVVTRSESAGVVAPTYSPTMRSIWHPSPCAYTPTERAFRWSPTTIRR